MYGIMMRHVLTLLSNDSFCLLKKKGDRENIDNEKLNKKKDNNDYKKKT